MKRSLGVWVLVAIAIAYAIAIAFYLRDHPLASSSVLAAICIPLWVILIGVSGILLNQLKGSRAKGTANAIALILLIAVPSEIALRDQLPIWTVPATSVLLFAILITLWSRHAVQ